MLCTASDIQDNANELMLELVEIALDAGEFRDKTAEKINKKMMLSFFSPYLEKNASLEKNEYYRKPQFESEIVSIIDGRI